MGFFDNLFAPFSTEPAQNAFTQAQNYYTQGLQQYKDYSQQASDVLQRQYGKGLEPSQNIFGTAFPALGQYSNALGLGGPQGNALATQGFWMNPQTQSILDIGSRNAMRGAAAAGGGAGGGPAGGGSGAPISGATLAALQNLGQQTAAGGWNQYLGNLNQLGGMAGQAAQGIGGLYSNLGNNLANIQQALGGAAYGTEANIGNAAMQAALAPYQAGANIWGAALGGLKGIAGSGGLFGSQGLIPGIRGMFPS
jgi:hypothetical protein